MAMPFCSRERRQLTKSFMSAAMGPSDLGKLLCSFFTCELTPIQKVVSECISRQDWLSLAKLSIDPRDYVDPEVYFWDRQATEFLRKYPFPSGAGAARDAAMSAFLDAEKRCAVTNRRFSDFTEHLHSETERHLIKRVRRHIAYILGEFCSQEMLDEAHHGPGSCIGLDPTLSVESGAVGKEVKYESKPSLTSHLEPVAARLLREYPAWELALRQAFGDDRFNVVRGNRITTVPKTALTDRTIAIEPMLNMFLQLGVGGMIRRRLAIRGGFNLDYSWSRNQEFARRGSIDGSFATIDLAAASDTVAYNVVGTLLPWKWFRALDKLRSMEGSYVLGDGKTHSLIYEKFSSMGNGATFELETLIFWAICRACDIPASDLAVYGDDICVPAAKTVEVISALSFFGFSVNEKKTFVSGPFRESCGKDFFNGRDVRPLYITKEVNNGQAIVDLANRLRDLGVRRNQNSGDTTHSADARFRAGWHYTIGFLSDGVRDAISSPPYTAFGLWKGGMVHETNSAGDYRPRWVISSVAQKAAVSFVGNGLLAARLSPSFPDVWRPFGAAWRDLEQPVGCGNSSILRGRVRFYMHLMVDTGNLSRWGGWL